MKRSSAVHNPVAKRLLLLMEEKKTNLALSADVTRGEELLEVAEELGPHLAILKTHIDMIDDFSPHLTTRLKEIAEKHRFLLFEDRKFADIGKTVRAQYEGGIYRISDWADIVNAHILPGPGIIEGLKTVGLPKGRGLLLLAEMSSQGNLATEKYTEQCVAWGREHAAFVMGFIAQRRLDPALLTLTPGVSLSESGDALGQQYVTPHRAICERGCDVIIVGRGIMEAPERKRATLTYQQAGWEAYLTR